MKFINSALLLCFLAMMPVQAMAQGHSVFCGQADSTAASQECLKRHLDSAQKRLNKVYQELGSALEGEKLGELKELQSTWLNYRDAECMWESERSVTPSLKRINELSCMARVTDDRADLLTVIYGDGTDGVSQREYGSFPRWMNALAKDHSDIYWHYGGRTDSDLNCDGENEYVMRGVRMSALKMDKAKTDRADGEEDAGAGDQPVNLIYESNMVLAIAQNPPTGRPTAKIIEFPVQTGGTGHTVCSDNVSFQFGERPAPKAVLEEEGGQPQEPACRRFLQLNQKGCDPKIISWTGKEFALEVEQAPEENKKETE